MRGDHLDRHTPPSGAGVLLEGLDRAASTCNSVSISALPCSRELLAARFVPETSSVSPRRCVRGEERVIVGRGRRVRCVLPQAGDRQDVVGLVYLCGFALNVVAQCVEQK